MNTLWPLGLYLLVALLILGGMLGLSYLVGERHRDIDTDRPYESGVEPTGTARVRLSAQFYLVAMFFVIFDLEVAILFAWAVVATEVGWFGFAVAAIFIVVLELVWGYLWAVGGLDWGKSGGAAKPPSSEATDGP